MYPVQGRASCPPTKNDPTVVEKPIEKHHHRFEMPPPLGKSVEHCFRKGMKPFPALAPLPLVNLLTYIFAH